MIGSFALNLLKKLKIFNCDRQGPRRASAGQYLNAGGPSTGNRWAMIGVQRATVEGPRTMTMAHRSKL